MSIKREVNLLSQPALIPLFGGMDKRPRALDREVITIGRARGCDIGLEAPDISTLHCILYRCPEGFKVRDCGSRTGTRVNGNMPRNSVLAEGDVLQVGPFCFKVKIPPASHQDLRQLDSGRFDHEHSSRQRLLQLALRLRKRLRGKGQDSQVEIQEELNHKATELRERIRHFDQKFNQLEMAERDLETDRDNLQREREAHFHHVQKAENDLAKRLEAADLEIKTRWQEFQHRCREEEAQVIEQTKVNLQKRHELDALTTALERDQKVLAEQQQHARQSIENSEHECEEAMNLKEQWAAQQAELNGILEKQRSALNQAETALREQRIELARIVTDLRDFKGSPQTHEGVESLALAQENEELRRMLGEYENRLAQIEGSVPQAPDQSKEVEDLKGENALLNRLLEEKETILEEFRNQDRDIKAPPLDGPPVPPANVDLESFEAELNQYRQQLELDRNKLNQEIDQLRIRNQELDDATRDMEMEMSKERAEFARERIRLDRLREELRNELERAHRDATVRESLAPVTKLREEITQKKSTSRDDGTRLNDRLRSFRNRLTDTPS